MLHRAGPAHPGILGVFQYNNPAKDMAYADIVRAIANLEASGWKFEGEFVVLNQWHYPPAEDLGYASLFRLPQRLREKARVQGWDDIDRLDIRVQVGAIPASHRAMSSRPGYAPGSSVTGSKHPHSGISPSMGKFTYPPPAHLPRHLTFYLHSELFGRWDREFYLVVADAPCKILIPL